MDGRRWVGSAAIDEEIINATRRWVERAVIGLGLCPFAESVYRSDRVRFYVSPQRSASALLEDLRAELNRLQREDPRVCETALLIHPWVLNDFAQFNDFLEICDHAVADLGLEGEIQVASFHPRYQFAGTEPDDIDNYTNRSPYPTLHLLREASVGRALEGMLNPDEIYENNVRRLQKLGPAGWRALWNDGSGS